MSTEGTAIVTGASSGIGAVYADRLARRAYDLILVARDAGRLTALADRLRHEYGVGVSFLPADLGRQDGLKTVVDRLRTDETISLLVNSAGLGPKGAMLAADAADLAQLVELNVAALHTLTVEAAKLFAARGDGAIINIASAVALMPEHFNASYVASKAFVLALVQALSVDLAPRGVRIQAVLPGFTRTEIFDRAGVGIEAINPDMLMEATELVDAALAGFDQGETVTIPSLANAEMWETFEQARQSLAPHLSLKHPASRYDRGVQPG